jgi:hypothetical protein
MNIVTAFKLTVCEWTIKFYGITVKKDKKRELDRAFMG